MWHMGELVHGRDVVLEVVALARKSALCARDRRVTGAFDERARTARSASCASASLAIAPGTASSVAYPRAMRSSSAMRISSSTRVLVKLV